MKQMKIEKINYMILLAVLILFLVLPDVSAFFPYYTYDPETKTASIKEDFGLTRVADIQLIEHTDECLIDCYSILEITFHKDINADDAAKYFFSFKDIRGRDAKNKLKEFNIYKKVIENYEVEIPIYETICENETTINGTQEKCVQNLIGTEQEIKTREVWQPFKLIPSSFKKLDGKVYLKLEGKKNILTSIDWIPTFYGLQINELAWWNASWTRCRNWNVTGGSEVLTNFIVYSNFSYDSDMQTDFDDIRFVNATCGSDGSEMAYEIDYKVNGSYAGVWVKVPTLNTGVNQFSVYYGNPSATSGEKPSIVWEDYVAVWHFSEDSGNILKDSKGIHNASLFSGTANWTSGIFGKGLYFDGSTRFNASTTNNYQQYTGQFYINPIAGGTEICAFARAYGQVFPRTQTGWSVGLQQLAVYWHLGSWVADYWNTGLTLAGIWWSMDITFISGTQRIYRNGVETNTFARTGTFTYPSFTGFVIGDQEIPTGGCPYRGYLDEVKISSFVRSAAWIARDYQNSNSSTYSFGEEQISTGVTSTLVSPPNNLITNNNTQNFTCNATATNLELKNITLYLWNTTGEYYKNTKDISGTSNQTSWIVSSITDGIYRWNCLVYDTTGNYSDWNDINWTLTIDTIAPSIIIVKPDAEYFTYSLPINISLNYTVSDANLQACWYSLNGGANISLPFCANTTFLVNSSGWHNIVVYANDTAGNRNSSTKNFFVNLLGVQSEIYDKDVIETGIYNFTLVLNATNITNANASLVWNNTIYPYTTRILTATSVTFVRTLTMPLINTTNLTISFFWNYTIYGNELNITNQTTTKNQTIHQILLGKCEGNTTTKVINFTLNDEKIRTGIYGDLDAVFTVWYKNSSVYREYSFEFNNLTVFDICMYPSWAEYRADALIDYYSTNYVKERYYLINASITNVTNQINLYDLKTVESTSFLLEVRDITYLVIDGAIIKIQRFYPEINQWLTVEMAKTDTFGQTIGHLYAEDADYKFLIEKENVLLYMSASMRAICLETPCKILFYIAGEFINPFEPVEDIPNLEYNYFYNRTTKMFYYNYNDLSGKATQARLYVKILELGKEAEVICDNIAYGVSGTISCNMTGYEGTAYTYMYISRNPELLAKYITLSIEFVERVFGAEGIFLGVLLLLVITFTGLWNPVVSIILFIVGIIVLDALVLIPMTTAAIISIILIGLIIIIKMKT